MKHLALVAIALLAGCNAANISPATVYKIEASYDAAVLAPAARYSQLPRCVVHAAPCSDPAIIHRLHVATVSANLAIHNARDFVRQHPTLDASAYLQAAVSAINTATAIAQLYGVR